MMNDGSKKIKNHAAPKIRRLLRPLRGLAMTASGEKGDGSVF